METKKPVTKRLKSATRYPRNNSSYVVAFALHETYDDLATAQHMICNRKSPKENLSENSITPDIDTGKESNGEQSSESNTETNILIPNYNIDTHLMLDTDQYQKGDIKEDILDPPEVLFSAQFNKRQKNKKQCSNRKLVKSHKKKGVLDIRNISFKYRSNKINTINKLGKFYSKARKNSVSDNLKLCTLSITNVISKSRILKKVSAKENLFDTESLYDAANLEENDSISPVSTVKNCSRVSENSMRSSVSTIKYYSSSSHNTLIHNEYLGNDDIDKDQNDTGFDNSVIDMSSGNASPYKTDILNVAVAVTFNKPNMNDKITSENCETKNSNNNLTSSVPTSKSSGSLTSHLDSTSSKTYEPKESDITLTGSDGLNQFPETDSDPYLFAESNSISKTISIPDLASQNTVNLNTYPNLNERISNESKTNNRQTLLDTVINLGIFSELTSSTEDTNKLNDLIKGNAVNVNFNNNGDHQNIDEKQKPTGVLQKTFSTEKTVSVQRNINLPNEDFIRNILIDRENLEKKSCSEEITAQPSTISELWESIVVILDLTVKRLENNLAEKIVKELLNSSPIFEKLVRPIPSLPTIEESVSAKPLSIHGDKTFAADEFVQCDLVEKQMIDNIMLKLSIQNPKPTSPNTSKIPLKIKKPKLVNDFVDVLKPPALEVTDVEKGDTVTISTDYAIVEDTIDYGRLDRFKSIVYVPVAFVRENLVVIASVTNFFVILLCLYALFVVVMKP